MGAMHPQPPPTVVYFYLSIIYSRTPMDARCGRDWEGGEANPPLPVNNASRGRVGAVFLPITILIFKARILLTKAAPGSQPTAQSLWTERCRVHQKGGSLPDPCVGPSS